MCLFRVLSALCICAIVGLSFIPGETSAKLSKGAISNTGKILNISNTKWIHYYIRRSCHPIEFLILEILLSLSFSTDLSVHLYSVLVAIAIAFLDEFVKLFIKGRHFSFEDILLDILGVVIASLVLTFIGRTNV